MPDTLTHYFLNVTYIMLRLVRAARLKPIAEKLKLEFPQLMDKAVDEFIEKHQVPTTPGAANRDRKGQTSSHSHRRTSTQHANTPNLIRRDIMKLSEFDIAKTFSIHQRELDDFR